MVTPGAVTQTLCAEAGEAKRKLAPATAGMKLPTASALRLIVLAKLFLQGMQVSLYAPPH
jgi:hypothetical protein